MSGFVRRAADGIRLSVRLTPRAASDAIDGIRTLSDGSKVLAARVRAVPEKGAANKALEKLLAKRFGISVGSVKITVGHAARVKIVSLTGSADELESLAGRIT